MTSFRNPALILGIYYLTPKAQRSGLLKNLRSHRREKALGIRNAAWDITFLSEWILPISRQNSENTLTILCSLDRNLIRLANMLAPHRIDAGFARFVKTLTSRTIDTVGQQSFAPSLRNH